MDKNFKIFGISFGLTGDLIMAIPVLTYFEKKYPNSYKYWGIEKKCAFTAPLFLNHPLIDKIVISKEWGAFTDADNYIIDQCQTKCTTQGWRHTERDWYNYRGQVEETARLAGIMDLFDVLNEEERKPKLVKWFEVGLDNPLSETHSKEFKSPITDFSNTIGIFPFSSGDRGNGRCPSEEWWKSMLNILIKQGYKIYHFGLSNEAVLSNSPNYYKFTNLSFFDQVKLALATKGVIATDSGPSWVISAYSHPCITLMTNWIPDHRQNFSSLAPIGDKVTTIFEYGGCDKISHNKVLDTIKEVL